MADEAVPPHEGPTREGGTQAHDPGEARATGPAGESARGAATAAFAELLSDAALGARRFPAAAGAALYEGDAPARSLYFIHEGQVRVFQIGPGKSAQLVEILGPGDWCGIPALAKPHGPGQGPHGMRPYGMRAVAVSAAQVSEVPAERLLAALSQQPAVAREMIAQLASKLQAAYGHAANLVFDDTEKRLIKALLQFSRTSAATPAPGQAGEKGVVLRITHQQLAQAVGAARETVSLTLTQLRQQKLLSTGRNRLSFDPRVLEEFARRSESAGAGAAAEVSESGAPVEPGAGN